MKQFSIFIISLLTLCAMGVQGAFAQTTRGALSVETIIQPPTTYLPGQEANMYTFASGTDTLDTYYLFDKNNQPYFDKLYVGNDIYEVGYLVQNAYINMNLSVNNNNKALIVTPGAADANGFTRYSRRPKKTFEHNGQTYSGDAARAKYYELLSITAGTPPTVDKFNNATLFTDRDEDSGYANELTDGIQYTWSAEAIDNFFGYYRIKRVRKFNAKVRINAHPKSGRKDECYLFKHYYYYYDIDHHYDLKSDEGFQIWLTDATAIDTKYYLVEVNTDSLANVYQKPENVLYDPQAQLGESNKIDGIYQDGAIAQTQGERELAFEYNVVPTDYVEGVESSGTWSKSWTNKGSKNLCFNATNGERQETVDKDVYIYVTDYVYVWSRVNTSTDPYDIDYKGLAAAGFEFSDENPVQLKSDAVVDVNNESNTYINPSKKSGYVDRIHDYGFVPVRQYSHNVVYAAERGVRNDWITLTEYDNANPTTPTQVAAQASAGSSCGEASFNRYDKTYPATAFADEVNIIPFGTPGIGTVGDMWIFQKSGNSYMKVGSNPTKGKSNQGKQVGQKIYITGSALNLTPIFTAGQGGWMQPVNTHIYLDGAKLQCQAPTGIQRTLVRKLVYNDSEATNDLKYKDATGILDLSASVFYLPAVDDTPTTFNGCAYLPATDSHVYIHLKDRSYLAGQDAQAHVKVTVDATATALKQTLRMPIKYFLKPYRHSPPIEIKDENYYFKWKKNTSGYAGASDEWRRERDEEALPDESLPQIYCEIDNVWADGSNLLYSYLDLTSQVSKNLDEEDESLRTQDGSANIYSAQYQSNVAIADRNYTPPLYTGGRHGHYIIRGGQINLWPAAVYMPAWKFTFHHNGNNLQTKAGLRNALPYANYLTCGYQQLSLVVTYANFENISGSFTGIGQNTIRSKLTGILQNADAGLQVNGIGAGQPLGELRIEGGTITTNADPNSFANFTASGVQKNNGETLGVVLTPTNTVINGGSFPGYNLQTTKKHDIASGIANAVPDNAEYRGVPVNSHKGQTLTKTIVNTGTILAGDNDFAIANHDYTAYDFSMLERDEPGARALLINRATSNATTEPYYYGMRSVVTTSDKTVVMYLPAGATKEWVQNYTLGEGNLYTEESTPQAYMTGKHIYHLNVPDNGYLAAGTAYNYKVARVNYKKSLTGDAVDHYYALSFPYQVAEVQDGGYVLDGSWVEEDVRDPSWDNDNAWYWRYFFGKTNDNTGNYTWIKDEFEYSSPNRHVFGDEYTTHATGNAYEANRPYLMRFKGAGWEGDVIEYRSADNTTELSTGTPFPNLVLEKSELQTTIGNYKSGESDIFLFQLCANNTLCKVPVTWSCYVINPSIFGDDDYHLLENGNYENEEGNSTQYVLYPFEAYLLGSTQSVAKFKRVGRETIINEDYDPNATDLVNVNSTGNLLVYGMVGEMHIWLNGEDNSAAQDVTVYTITGELVYQTTLPTNQMLSVPAATGVYIVRANGNAVKVIVQ